MKNFIHCCSGFLIYILLIATSFDVKAYSVTELQASYSNGQTFLTWKNPSVSNLQYNVYRSASPLSSASDLNTATFLGFVRD
ncbi:MAG: hypothetical protein H0V65_07565, partial [Chitinophagales bacterium]|nr:hypothetical protein [Chitinophagales bacterium]